MNEEKAREEKLDEKRKSAVLRYIAILFAVAFLLVLISLLGQMRNNLDTITALNESSTSALQKAEQLQDRNRELEAQLAELTELQEEKEALEQQLAETEKASNAYEQLLLAMELVTPGAMEGNVAAEQALDSLEQMKDYLGPRGLEKYESLLEEVE